METDSSESVRQAFQILELIDSLRDVQWCQLSTDQAQNIEMLLDDLEDSYRDAMEPWSMFRTTPGELLQEDFYRWHEYMFPPEVFQGARLLFCEMVTTSRFAVEAGPCMAGLQEVNSPTDKIVIRHIVSLAALVCIQFSLWDIEHLNFLDAQQERDYVAQKVDQARSFHKNADLWLSHLATLGTASIELNHALKKAIDETKRQHKAEVSERSKRPGPRVAKDLTPEVIANYFNANHNADRPKNKKVIKIELMEMYGISLRALDDRIAVTRKMKLMQ